MMALAWLTGLLQLLADAWKTAPFTSRFEPVWAYIDDYLWYALLWLRVHQVHGDGDSTYLTEAAETFDLNASRGDGWI